MKTRNIREVKKKIKDREYIAYEVGVIRKIETGIEFLQSAIYDLKDFKEIDGVDDSDEETPKRGERYSCLRSDGNTNYFKWEDTLYDRARWNEGNCKRMGVDDSEEVEEEKLTFNELTVLKSFTTTELDRWTHIPNAEPKRSYLSGIVGKLNKMLKEKE